MIQVNEELNVRLRSAWQRFLEKRRSNRHLELNCVRWFKGIIILNFFI